MKIKDYIVPKTTASIILSQGIMFGTAEGDGPLLPGAGFD